MLRKIVHVSRQCIIVNHGVLDRIEFVLCISAL